MGALENGGKVAISLTESMKSQPLALALIVVNVMFLVFIVWVLHQVVAGNRLREAHQAQIVEELKKTCELARQK